MRESLRRAFETYDVVLEPDRNEPEWWAGAPSVTLGADGAFWLAARMREGTSPPGERGYEVRLLRSGNGIRFEPVHAISREALGVRSVERPALVHDPHTGLFKIYLCATRAEGGWHILRLDDAADPARFDPGTARVVVEAPDSWGTGIGPGFKDPFVLWAEGCWHLYAIGIDRVERVHHFTSDDGEKWTGDPRNPIFDNGGWHNFYTRPACVLPMDAGYLFVYEGSHAQWRDPNYNIATGLAYTLDLSHVVDLTPQEPLVKSGTPGGNHTWRYSHWLRTGGRLFIYAECARPNDTNEIRLFRV
ncbi:MAG TPA: hypothetical protein PKO36_15735 [Candidatus Hydrogenedentes bacterium]|nr:hypothetical protein [Candidatus Hydrogenedentota bacterium]HOT50773.1 hypothetical protein [Candidatus Hydrogenedentota bacterium]HOV74126.1 hypothetical protein [Candidatus Hydrogenedentota bacterium]HPC15665.1 hypothetical protein [Candidatus Hydrogenedentota bacterium]HRT19711.1 hypothetical protein [Candidatus Hydrogenedentota bacterium]